jgi:multimeric flavodoxin WrbA
MLVKVLAIMGSPRKAGNTYKVTKKVEERMKEMGAVEFEYVFLRDLDLKPCLGCGACLDRGEEKCPLKDGRAMLEEKMQGADGVIFASPTYVFNVTGLMKNFFDRFAYACHRPRFFKSAMVLTTSGIGAGAGIMLMTFSLVPRAWGFKVASSLAITTNGLPEYSTPEARASKKIDKAAKKFYRSVAAGRPKPGLFGMATFMAARPSIRKIPQEFFDYHYWKDHGWLEKSACYYYDEPQPGMVGKSLAGILARFMGLFA